MGGYCRKPPSGPKGVQNSKGDLFLLPFELAQPTGLAFRHPLCEPWSMLTRDTLRYLWTDKFVGDGPTTRQPMPLTLCVCYQ